MSADHDIVVLGGGPGGYATALRAVARGLRVVLVEDDKVGGTCLHRGCVPSKALLHIGHLADLATESAALGLTAPGPGLDLAAASRYRDGIVEPLHRGLAGLLRGRGIDVVAGRGTIVEPGHVAVRTPDGETTAVSGRHIVIATGSSPVELAAAPTDHVHVLSSDDALQLQQVPRRGLVVGGGAIGVEIASLWRSLGSDVTIVEASDRIVPLEDVDSSVALTRAFARRGIGVRTGVALVAATRGDAVVAELSDGTAVEVDQVLVAVGRRPATAGLGLDELGLLDERGHVRVDPWGRSPVEGLWAVGDVAPTLALAHAAFAEGFTVADAIAGEHPTPVDHDRIPRVTYCTPEVGSVGLTEAQARERHAGVEVTTTTLAGNARAAMEGTGGQVKVVHDSDGVLLGGHIVAPSATELIAELGAAIAWEATVGELADIVHAHPTLAESVRETALAAAGLPFHTHRP